VWVEARISGRLAFGIFDTGSDGTVLDTELSRELGFSSRGQKSATSVGGEVKVESIENTEFALADKKLVSMETHALPLSSQLEDLEFILGFDALAATPFTLLTEKRRIVFDRIADVREYSFCKADDIRPTVAMEILTNMSIATVDTGSAQGVSLPKRWVEANAGRLGLDRNTMSSRVVLGSNVQSSAFRIKEMALCGVKLENVPAEAVQADEGSFAEQETLWGNIGNQVLFRFESIFVDGKRRVLALGRRF
jgi:predicted aspartyl protease